MVILDHRLEVISKGYVHRKTTGYKRFDVLLSDLVGVALDIPNTGEYSEYWLRVANDVAEYTSKWRLEASQVPRSLELFTDLEQLLLKANLNQTQKIRLRSIVTRTRAEWAEACPQDLWQDIYEEYLSAE